MKAVPDPRAQRGGRGRARLRRVAAGLAACGVGAGCTLALADSSSTPAHPSVPARVTSGSFAPSTPVTSVQPALAAHFAIMRQPAVKRGSKLALPALGSAPGVAATAGSGAGAHVAMATPIIVTPGGVNPQLARAVDVPTSNLSDGHVWAMPGNNGLCLRVDDPAGGDALSCATTDSADDGQLVGTLQSSLDGDGETFVYGLVPDGVSQVTVTTDDGSSQDVPVQSNIYAATLQSSPDDVSFRATDGQATQVAAP